jgi:soluble lytic murein transglycosylase-like protein
MLRFGLLALLLFATPLPAGAAVTDMRAACFDAAGTAERNWMLPPDLINAIGRVESGRYDRTTGRVSSWPWTVNANGSGYWFASLAEAVAFVKALQSHGVRLIDVGCFQVDLFYHPQAFASLEQAFDPAANADYAARFLTVLHGQTGSWPAAIAGYHSGIAAEGERYRQKVMGQWGSSGGVAGTTARPGAGDAVPDRPTQDRYVVLMSAAARAIRVFGP